MMSSEMRKLMEAAMGAKPEPSIKEADHYRDLDPRNFNPGKNPTIPVLTFQEFKNKLPKDTESIDSTRTSKTGGTMSIAYKTSKIGPHVITGIFRHMDGHGEVLAPRSPVANTESMRGYMESAKELDSLGLYDEYLEVIDEYLFHLYRAYEMQKLSSPQVRRYKYLKRQADGIKDETHWKMAEFVAEQLRLLAYEVGIVEDNTDSFTTVSETKDKTFAAQLARQPFGYTIDKDKTGTFVQKRVPLGQAVFTGKDDGIVCLSAEYEHTAGIVLDYYGEYRDGHPYVSKEIEAFAKQHNKEIQWKDPATVCFYDR